MIAGLAGSVACDKSVAPARPSLSNSARPGDFIIHADAFRFPDSVRFADTIRVPFTVGDGRDPCSFIGNVRVSFGGVSYFVPWGVRSPGSSCKPTTFDVFNPGSWRDWDPGLDSVSLAEIARMPIRGMPFRLVVCYPDGSYVRKDVVFVGRWISDLPVYDVRDSARVDSRTCADFARSALAG